MRKRKGYILISVLVIMTIMLVMTYFLADALFSEMSIARNQKASTLAFHLAEAGAEEAIWAIQNDPDTRDTFLNNANGETTLSNSQTLLSGGTYSVTIKNTAQGAAIITSTALYNFGLKQAQRVITLHAYQTNNPGLYNYDAGLFVGGPNSGDINLTNVNISQDGGYDPSGIIGGGNINATNATINLGKDYLSDKEIDFKNTNLTATGNVLSNEALTNTNSTINGATVQGNTIPPLPTFNLPNMPDITSDCSINPNSYKCLSKSAGTGETKTVYLEAGATSWLVPADFNSAHNTIGVYGPGGKGGGKSAPTVPGGGGGGGAYASITNRALTPGATINVQVGAGSSEGDTWFFNTSTVLAKAGKNVVGATAGTGGSSGSCVGAIKNSGGNGAAGAVNKTGGGGGAGGPTGIGGNGTQGSPGLGGTADGGISGAGGSGGLNGNPGNNYGGAGGGGGNIGATGGAGAPGRIVITYTSTNSGNQYYSSSQTWTNLANLTLNGIIYVAGSATFTNITNLTINGILVAEGSISFTNIDNLIVNHTSGPSGIITLQNLTTTNVTGVINGLVYVAVQAGVAVNTNLTINGAFLAHSFTATNATLKFNLRKDWVNEALQPGTTNSPVIQFEHWEEEY